MPDPRDIVEIAGVANPSRGMPASSSRPGRPWLGVYFRCCHVYGRMHRTPDGRRYTGRCPRCLAEVQALIGPGGTTRRIFTAE